MPSHYFDVQNGQFISFFEQHLKYSRENPGCLCYWPYRSMRACKISDSVYNAMSPQFANSILSNLFIHSFFYSQYREALFKLAEYEEVYDVDTRKTVETINSIYKVLDELCPEFLKLYSQCLKKHPHPKIYYERGMVFFHQGMTLDALGDIRALLDWARLNHQEDLLTSELYLQEGTIYSELGLYDKAVEGLSLAIDKDPNNKEAYYERAGAYFELGDFDLSLKDYLASEITPQAPLSNSIDLVPFSLGLTRGLVKGGMQAGTEFIPSLLASANGIGHGLWAVAQEPVQSSLAFAEAVQDCFIFIKEHASKKTLKHLVHEFKELIEAWNDLGIEKRGEVLGLAFGRGCCITSS